MNDDKRVLKHIMVDILNLRNGMEKNLILMKQKGGDDAVIHVAQQHIDSISTVYTLGVSWLKGETDFALCFIQGNFFS